MIATRRYRGAHGGIQIKRRECFRGLLAHAGEDREEFAADGFSAPAMSAPSMSTVM